MQLLIYLVDKMRISLIANLFIAKIAKNLGFNVLGPSEFVKKYKLPNQRFNTDHLRRTR